MYIVPSENYCVGPTRDWQNICHYVSISKFIGGKIGMSKDQLKKFVNDEIKKNIFKRSYSIWH